jgi:hypothetical protein
MARPGRPGATASPPSRSCGPAGLCHGRTISWTSRGSGAAHPVAGCSWGSARNSGRRPPGPLPSHVPGRSW